MGIYGALREKKRFERLVLELSLKPFRSLEPEQMKNTCRQVFGVWSKLIDRCDDIAIQLWVSDGSDVLEWSGNLDQNMVTAQSIGFCNLDEKPSLYYTEYYRTATAVPYMDQPARWTYRDLRFVIACLRDVAHEEFGRSISVGATLDPGPEFAESPFKYRRHREMLVPNYEGRAPMHFLSCQAILEADPDAFGGFPEGLPAGTSMGSFLGSQFQHLAKSVNYDFLWLSNGFGYSNFPWSLNGEILRDGQFHCEDMSHQREMTNGFWKDFRGHCQLPVEVRGTNNTVGVDLASDGISHVDIAAAGNLKTGPCNVPILNPNNVGLEVVSYLTRIAHNLGDRIPYRGYINDPWFNQTPWYDILNRETFSIACCTSLARLNDKGGVDTQNELHLLTIDNEFGELLPNQANEIIPMLLRFHEEAADAAGPLVWVYPFEENDTMAKERPEEAPHLFFHDQLIMRAVDGGLPLSTVVDSRRFTSLAERGALPCSIYLAPVPLGTGAYLDALLDFVSTGGQVMLYGSLQRASDRLLEALSLNLEAPLDGDFEVQSRLTEDLPATDLPLRHRSVSSGGGLCAVPKNENDDGLLITVSQNNQKRAYGVSRQRPEWNGGRLVWLRGTLTMDLGGPGSGPSRDRANTVQMAEVWLRYALEEFGISIRQQRRDISVEPTRMLIKRHRGAWYFVGAKADTSVHSRIRLPDGAPVFMEYDTPLIDGFSEEHFAKTIYNEVRFFVQQKQGLVKCKMMAPHYGKEVCLKLSGCEEARVTIYPDPVALDEGRILLVPWADSDCWDGKGGGEYVAYEVDKERQCLIVEKHSGPLYIKW